MDRPHGAFTEPEFVIKTWAMNMESTAHNYQTSHDIQDFNPQFSDVTMSFPDLETNDLPSYMTDEVHENNPDVTSTLSPYQDLDSYHEVNMAVEHTNSAVPSISPYPGEHNFQVAVQKQTKETKSVNWIYSEEMGKLYVRMNVPCPFLFRTSHAPPRGSLIRATPIFWNPEHVNEVVKRCPTHIARSPNEPMSQVKHLLTSDHREARHVEDSVTRRLCVVIPHEEPQVGSAWVTSLFRFMCFSSCHGGYNKRPLHVIFTLEHDNQVLGRQVLRVRLCACPGRDWDIETKPKSKKKKGSPTRPKTPRVGPTLALGRGEVTSDGSQPSGEGRVQVSSTRKRRFAEQEKNEEKMEEEEVFTLQVKGKVNYNILCKLRDSLHLFSLYKNENSSDALELYNDQEQSPKKRYDESNAAQQLQMQQQQQQQHQLHHHQQQQHFLQQQHRHHPQQQQQQQQQQHAAAMQQNQALTFYQQLSY